MSTKIQVVAGVISLIALLAYTLVHTGGLLADYVRPEFVGYVAALGIELAVVSLSLRIGDLRRTGQDFGFFMFVLVSVVIVSALANIAEGFAVAHGEALTFTSVRNLDAIQAVIGLTATGLISLIVLALSEIIGTDINTVVSENQREQKRRERELSKIETEHSFPYPIEAARLTKADKKQERLDALAGLLAEQPDATPTIARKEIGISKSTFYAYVNELETNGIITRNGNGIVVVSENKDGE